MPYKRPRVVRPSTRHLDLLYATLIRFLNSAAARPETVKSDTALANFEEEIAGILGACFGRQFDEPGIRRGRPIVTDRLMVARAIDAIEASGDSELSMEGPGLASPACLSGH